MHRLLICVSAAALAACATAPVAAPDPGRVGLQPPPDTCGASRYAHLLGRPMSEAPPAGSIPNYRLAATDDPLTMDHNPERLNIFYDRSTGHIVGIRCF